MNSEVEKAIIEYVNVLNAKLQTVPGNLRFPNGDHFAYEVGRKYVKVYRSSSENVSWARTTGNISWQSVHSFVVKSNGDLLKAATWHAPAKGVRFNLLRDMETIKQIADVYTSFLYSRP